MAAATDVTTYKFNHSMIRVKDPERSIKFYSFLGMSLIKTLPFPSSSFTLYFLGYDHPISPSHSLSVFDRQGIIELTHNHGTEADADFAVNNGNAEPHRGFGHVCVSVDNLQAACRRLDEAGYRFKKRLEDGKMRNIAFVLDPDGYWVEIIGQKGVEETEGVETTDMASYRMNHTMIRVKDAQKSLAFYQQTMGMNLLRTLELGADCTLYFLGYHEAREDNQTAHFEGVLELTWNHGTENDEAFSYHSGNTEPKGFGHICVSVDDIEAACARFEGLGCEWKKRLTDGSMKNIAFLLDPDGYWIEIVQNERFTGKENF